MSMSISKTKRLKVVEKAKGRCVYCGVLVDVGDRCMDHVIPRIDGGSNQIENLVLSCRSCNSIKSTNSVEHFRLSMRLKESKFSGIINTIQYQALIDLGVKIELPQYKFHFEGVE